VFVCCNLIALSLFVSAYTHYYDRALHHCIGKIYPAGIIIMALGKVSQSRIWYLCIAVHTISHWVFNTRARTLEFRK